MWVVTAAAEDVRVTGEVAAFRSSPFAERAFCPVCGTHLWIRDDGGDYDLMPGLFDAAAGLRWTERFMPNGPLPASGCRDRMRG